MSDLHKEKVFEKKVELEQVALYQKYIATEREQFDYADVSMWLLENKNESDLALIMDSFCDWMNKSDTDVKKKKYSELMHCILRIQSYCTVSSTVSKQAASKLVSLQREFNHLSKSNKMKDINHQFEVDSLKKQLKIAKDEIEFLSK